MSLTKLVQTLNDQASQNKGDITIDAATFTSSDLTPPAGLDDLLTKGYALKEGRSLIINIGSQTIADPTGDTLTIKDSTTGVLNVESTNTAVTLTITVDSSQNVQFTIQVDLSNWEFKTSWPLMTGGVFDNLPYSDPSFVFSTIANIDFTWGTNKVALVAGQNFAAMITLTGLLAEVIKFIPGWNANTGLALIGSLDPSMVDDDKYIYPDMDLFVKIDATPVSLLFLDVENPGVGLMVQNIEVPPETSGNTAEESTDTTVKQSISLYFFLNLLVGDDIILDFTTTVVQGSSKFSIAAAPDPDSVDITPLNLFSLMAGNNWFSNVPGVIQQFLNAIKFKGFAASVDLSNGVAVNSVSASVGSTGEWVLFNDFTIKEFDVNWQLLNPTSKIASDQTVFFKSKVDFFPDTFVGGFDIEFTSKLVFSASFNGVVSVNKLISNLSHNLINIPTSIASVEFTSFGVNMDVNQKFYSIYAAGDASLDFITNISITNAEIMLTSTVPANDAGNDGSKNVYNAEISGLFGIGTLFLQTDVKYNSATEGGGWDISIAMQPGAQLNIKELLAKLFEAVSLPQSFLPDTLAITSFALTANIPNGDAKGAYAVKTSIDWAFTFPIIDQKIDITAALALAFDPSKPDGQQYSGAVMGTILLEYFNAEIGIGYNFAGTDKELIIQWEGFIAKYDVEGKARTITFEIENWSVGEIITSFMKMLFNPTFELESPWDLLNKISLDGFTITYNLDNQDVTVDYSLPQSIDLVFVKITGIKLTKSSAGVQISLDGSSLVPEINESSIFNKETGKGQDVTKMPKVPGKGNKYFDLRLLAMGQHVALKDVTQYKTIQEVTTKMAEAFQPPADGVIPITGSDLLSFDENSSWLIATNFGILNVGTEEKPVFTIDMQIVFNDPNLYGLRIAMAGEKAKIFAGLDFEILYKKISDTVGVYQIDLTLPDALRYLQFGAVNVTLPSISIQIYTNGDFMVDIGFPYNLDFSRSFSVQAIVPPGIPAMGSGGFYFGKLSSATTKKVPQTTYGDFNPVIVFGIGMQIGVGYSVNYGVLKAGFSITIFGIVEGVIATYHPYHPTTTNLPAETNSSEVETSYYYWLQGTFGIIGKLYGSIDFGIISASVNITIKVYVQATIEAYNKIPLAIVASVSVKVSAKLNLGIFSITIHFSFNATIRQDVTIGTDNTANAPWNLPPSTGTEAMALKAVVPQARLLKSAKAMRAPQVMTYQSFLAASPEETAPTLNIYFAPHLTIAGPENGDKNDQTAQYVATLWIDSPDPEDTTSISSFEYLSQDFFRWLVTNYLTLSEENSTREHADSSALSILDLDALLKFLSNEEDPLPIPPDKLLSFLQSTFSGVNVQNLSSTNQPKAAALFPMIFDLELSVPGANVDIDFSSYNMATDEYLTKVKEWFAQLAVKVSEESSDDPTPMLKTASASNSISTFVFEDYFVLIGKQLIGYATDALKNYTYPLSKGNSLSDIITWANDIPETDGLSNSVSAGDLAKSNQTHPLNGDLDVTISGVMHSILDGETFDAISLQYALQTALMITQNSNVPGIVATGQTITIDGNSYTVQEPMSIDTIVANLGGSVTLAELAADPDFQQKTILTTNALLSIAAVQYGAKNEDTFTSITSSYTGITAANLLLQNQIAPGLFIVGNTVKYQTNEYKVIAGDTVKSIAKAFSVMISSTVTIDDLTNDSDFQASDVQALATVLIPPFIHPTPVVQTDDIAAADTLGSIAQKYSTTAEILGSGYANQQIENLFYATGDYVTVNVPDLVCLDVQSILDYFSANKSYTALAGMASRYQMHGMRLPLTDNGVAIPGITLSDGSPCSGQDDCALFRLTGQQFELPADVAADFKIELVNKKLDWLQFNGVTPTVGAIDETLTVELTSDDITQISTLLGYAQDTGLQPEVTKLATMTPYELMPMQYSFQTETKWECSGEVILPYGDQGDQVATSPIIWNFPSNLLQKIAQPKRAGSAFDIQIGTYNSSAGVMDYKSSSHYGWSTLLTIDVKKLSSDANGTSPFTYEMLGANEAGTQILERLLFVLDPNSTNNNSGVVADIQWLYEGGDGLQSVGNINMKTFLVQSNLSTETNPQTQLAKQSTMLLAETPQPNGVKNSIYDFVKLLWECSITRSGGYYLLYNEILNAAGFPDSIFDQSGNASISLLVTYADAYNDKLQDFMNCAITGDKIDTTSSIVYAESVAQKGLSYETSDTDETLASIAAQYNILVSQLAVLNEKVALAISAGPIVLNGLMHEVGLPSANPANTLQAIATYYGVADSAIEELNPEFTLTQELPIWQLIVVPEVSYTIAAASATSPGNTLLSIADYYFIDVPTLAFEVQNLAIFGDKTTLEIVDQIVHKVSSVPQGKIGFELQRPDPGTPPAKPSDPGYAETYLDNLYNLLSYQVVANDYFTESIVGLPSGPGTPKSQDEILGKSEATNEDVWNYSQVIPISQFAVPNSKMSYPAGLPGEEYNPYRGIGNSVQVHFDWVDYYGNKTVTPFSDPALNPNSPLNNPAIQVGYMDELKGFSQWPGLFITYKFDQDANKKPQLSLAFSFNTERYQNPDPSDPKNDCLKNITPNTDKALIPGWQQNAIHDLSVYTSIYYQINQLNPTTGDNTLSMSLRSTLTPGTSTPLSSLQVDQVNTFVEDIYKYLMAISTCAAAPANPTMDAIVEPVDVGNLESDSIFQLAVNLDLKRDLTFVNNDFKDSPLVTSTSTAIQPDTNLLAGVTVTGDKTQQHTLTGFAQSFEQAFYLDGEYILKIATGVNEVTAGGQKNQAIYVTRMGLKPGVGIYWNVEQAGSYQISEKSMSALIAAGTPTSVTDKLASLKDKTFTSTEKFNAALNGVISAQEFKDHQLSIYTNALQNPAFYAPRPTSTSLKSKKDVPICSYVTGQGLNCTNPETKNFTGIDLDIWGKQSLEAIDLFLGSEFAVPAFLVDQLKEADEKAFLTAQGIEADSFLEAITNSKNSLADTLSATVEPVLTAPNVSSTNLANAQEKFRQQLLMKLGSNYTISSVVQMDVTAESGIDSGVGNQVAPRLYGAPTITGPETAEDSKLYSLSNAKIQLNYNGDTDQSDLSFIFSTKNAKLYSSVPLTMDYQITHIEFDIENVPNVKGYQASQWLTFVIPVNLAEAYEPTFDMTPLQQSLGTLDIPIVLRNYPTPPSLTKQEGNAVPTEGNTATQVLEKASEWDFLYTYSEDQAAQDQIYSDITFNSLGAASFKKLLAASPRDLFKDMAQLISVWPNVLGDLTKYLAEITPSTEATDSNVENAYFAMQAFVQMVNNLAIAWQEYVPAGLNLTSGSAAERAYDFKIQQMEDKVDNEDRLLIKIVPPSELTALDKELFLTDSPVTEANLPETPVVAIKGYEREVALDTDKKPIPNSYWYYTMNGTDKVYLSWTECFSIPDRTVEVDGLNVLQFQHAWAGVAIIRNEGLIPNNPTRTDFIYRTPLVRFSNKLIPLLKNGTNINIAELESSPSTPIPLADHLATFFSTFFTSDELAEQTIKLSASWNYSLQKTTTSTTLPPVQLPVLLYTPFSFEIPTDYQKPTDGCPDPITAASPFICQLAAALKAWYDSNQPVTTDAFFKLDLSVFSALSETQLPLIELSNLTLPYLSISDMDD